jgi:hypothetical protein
VALLFRCEPGRIAALGDNPPIEFRAGAFFITAADAALVPILVRVGPESPENLYEAWANDPPQNLGHLIEALAAQDRIGIFFYGEGCRLEQTFRVPNQLQAFARQFQSRLASTRHLSGDSFHQARQAVYRQHATVTSLWKALKA